MPHIPLHEFRYQHDRPLPCEIGRIEHLPGAARATYPNRHTFYELFWITQGAGSHTIDFEPHPIRPQTLYVVAPGQIHFWQIAEPVSGYAILLAPEFFQQGHLSGTLLDDVTLFRSGECQSAIALDGSEAAMMDQLVGMLFVEYSTPQFGQLDTLQALVQIMLIRAQRLVSPGMSLQEPPAATRLTRQFLRLVEAHYAKQHAVAAYAAQLGITPGHLTDTIRQTLGRSAGEIIRERYILEAKRMLAHSDTPIAGIAQQLHFDDPSYFTRSFRQSTGQTPQEFRATFRDLYQSLHQSALD